MRVALELDRLLGERGKPTTKRQAACKTLGTSGRSSSRPGNSHRFGRASRQSVRKILRSCGESMT